MRIALINPPSQDIKNSVKDLLYGCWCQGKRIGGSTFPPLNLLSIGTLLEKDNFIKVIDGQSLKLDYSDLIKYLARFHVIILPTTSFCYKEDVTFLKEIKRLNSEVITIIFGTYSTFYPEKSVNSQYVNFGIIGEPEIPIKNLIDEIKNGLIQDRLKSVKGLCYRKKENIINSGRAPFIENLDDLPIPNRDHLEDLYYFNPLVKNKEWTTALTSRGCPASCIFCLSPEFYGNKYRFQTPNRMIEEIKYLLNKNYKEIFYRDETFTGNKERILKYTDLIKKNGLHFDWICNVRIGTVNKNLLGRMKTTGCHYIKIGVESGSQQILNNLKKGVNIKDTVNLFDWARELDIKTHAHVILGTIGETEFTIRKTIEFVKKINPTTITFNLFAPYPGTRIFEELTKKTQDKIDIDSFTFQEAMTNAYLSEYYTDLDQHYLNELIPIAYRKYYLRMRYIISRIKDITSFFSLKLILKSGFNIISFIFSTEETNKLSSLENI